MIRVVIDGIVYGKSSSEGISRYWTEVLRAFERSDIPVRCDLVVPQNVRPLKEIRCHREGTIGAYWAAWRADLFHSTYYTRWPRLKCPSVATAYDFIDASFPEYHPNGAGFVERQYDVLRRAAAVIAISKSTRDLAVELAGIDTDRIFVAYPAVAEPFSLPPPGGDEIQRFRREHTGGAPYLVHVGRRRIYKNFLTILKAFVASARDTDRHLLVVGGPPDWTAEESEALDGGTAAARIHLIPKASDDFLRLAYAGADALVHASRMEGFGIPVIEALACGTSLILSDIPVYREIAEGMAVFVAPLDVEAWTQAIRTPQFVQPKWREEVRRRYAWEGAARMHRTAYAYAALHPSEYSPACR